jgi:predicted porin
MQANIGAKFASLAIDAYYSKLNGAITAASLSQAQVTQLVALGYAASNSLAGTISDDRTYSLMASYRLAPDKLFAGYMNIEYADPKNGVNAGFNDIGDYVLAFVTNNAYIHSKVIQVYWTGLRYAIAPQLEWAVAYYGYRQTAYGTGKEAGCSSSPHSVCSGSFEAFSVDADYRFNKHFDAYLGAMYSGVHDGAASGYIYSTNINPTVGVRYKF